MFRDKRFMAILGICLVVVVAAFAIGAAAQGRDRALDRASLAPVASEDDASGKMEVRLGDEFPVSLEGNITTGYDWALTSLDDKVVTLVKDEYVENQAAGVVGAGGRHVFYLKAVGKGTATVQFDYRRPWETGVAPIEVHTVEVTVR